MRSFRYAHAAWSAEAQPGPVVLRLWFLYHSNYFTHLAELCTTPMAQIYRACSVTSH